VQVALDALALDTDAFAEIAEFGDDAAIEALCTGGIDATILTLGHPSALVRQAVERCGARLVPLGGPAIESLIDGAPYYVLTDVPAGTYDGQDEPVASFGVRAFLLARTSLDDAVVARLAEELLAVTSRSAPMPAVMTQVTSADLPDVRSLVPLHRAALEAYRAAGLIE
jgi:TRAP transporter TAXI family solute receptor